MKEIINEVNRIKLSLWKTQKLQNKIYLIKGPNKLDISQNSICEISYRIA